MKKTTEVEAIEAKIEDKFLEDRSIEYGSIQQRYGIYYVINFKRDHGQISWHLRENSMDLD